MPSDLGPIGTESAYQGDELALFQHAVRWKGYLGQQLSAYLRGNVLEVGAGLGATTEYLLDGRQATWTCLEPDGDMADALRRRFPRPLRGVPISVIHGTTAKAPEEAGPFDCVLYVDVLEHIDDDRAELARAASLLTPGGAIVAVSPAHQWLYTPFDRRIGHCRRYSRRSLRESTPDVLSLERTWYLDAAGLLASLGNRVWLSQDLPTLRQILIWDRRLVPISRVVDPLLLYRVGRSIASIWRRTEPDAVRIPARSPARPSGPSPAGGR